MCQSIWNVTYEDADSEEGKYFTKTLKRQGRIAWTLIKMHWTKHWLLKRERESNYGNNKNTKSIYNFLTWMYTQ